MQICRTDRHPRNRFRTLAKRRQPLLPESRKMERRKGDIVRDFVNSCRKYGLQPGIYIGIRWNSLLGIHNFKAEGEGAFARNRQAWYKRLCEKMVTELCTRYGDLYMIWFDGGADDPVPMAPTWNRLSTSISQTAFSIITSTVPTSVGEVGDRYSGISLLVYLSRPLLTP